MSFPPEETQHHYIRLELDAIHFEQMIFLRGLPSRNTQIDDLGPGAFLLQRAFEHCDKAFIVTDPLHPR